MDISLSERWQGTYNRIMFSLIIFMTSIAAGLLGAILGLGGGLIIVPVLTLGFNVDIRYAIAASLVSIIATSSGAAAGYLRDRLTNLRLAVLLEAGTVTGAMTGFVISSFVNSTALYFIYALFLVISAFLMLKRRSESSRATANHPWAEKLKLAGADYMVSNVITGRVVMYFAGILSAMLGIGSGIFKVLAMDGAMKLPMKVSSATSNFMIGVTAAASAGAFFLRGDIRPEIAAPVAVGIIIGSWTGGILMPKMNPLHIKRLFVAVLLIVAIQMTMKGIRS